MKEWDFKVSETSHAMTIAHYYLRTYYQSGKIPSGMNYMEKMKYMSSESSHGERVQVFMDAMDQLYEDFGSVQVPWGEVNRYQRNDGAIKQEFSDSKPSIPVGMASGRWGALASFGAKRGKDTKCHYGVSGNSFVAVVEFGKRVKAKSLLAGGQSGDPTSVHFSDQVMPYVNRQFKTVAFYREDVLKRAKKRYHPGE